MTYFWNIGTPSISRERFELETSNLACRLTIGGMTIGGTNDKNEKLGQRGSGSGHVTYFWNFGTPSISRERLELETSNLACRLTIGGMTIGGTNDKYEKLGQRGSGRGHVTYFWNFFGSPSISGERLELETSNLACRLTTGGTNDKNEKLGQRGSGRGHVTYFWNFGTRSISRERFELETSNLACRLTTGGINDNNEKLGQRGSGRGHVTYFCSIGSQILYIFETHGIGQTPSSLERYLVVVVVSETGIVCFLSVSVSVCPHKNWTDSCDAQLGAWGCISKMIYKSSKLGHSDLFFGLSSVFISRYVHGGLLVCTV